MQYPISEIFGSTIAGEGFYIGVQTHFVRFAGCDFSPGCVWCIAEGQMVVMADGTEKPIEKIEVGDVVLGAVGESYKFAFAESTVLSTHRVGDKPVVDFEGLICTPAHEAFDATIRGYVEVNRFDPSHTIAFVPTCKNWDGPSWLSGYLDGDGSFYGQVRADGGWQSKFKVTSTDPELIDIAETVMKENGFSPRRVRHDAGRGKFKQEGAKPLQALEITRTKEAETLQEFVDLHRGGPSYLGGFFDAEGSFDGITIKFAQKKSQTRQYLLDLLQKKSVKYKEYGESTIALVLGGQPNALAFFAECGMVLHRKWRNILGRRIIPTEVLGLPQQVDGERVVYDITTTTGNFFAEGILVHNCDTKYAVNPSHEGWSKTMMTEIEILEALNALNGRPKWVTLSGGNPALFVTDSLICELGHAGYSVALETQGTAFGGWAYNDFLEELTISPKPPSSGMSGWYEGKLDPMIEVAFNRTRKGLHTTFKYVVFDDKDLKWVKDVVRTIGPLGDRILSVGTLSAYKSWSPATRILEDMRGLVDKVKDDPFFGSFRILPQLHVLLYGQRRGI